MLGFGCSKWGTNKQKPEKSWSQQCRTSTRTTLWVSKKWLEYSTIDCFEGTCQVLFSWGCSSKSVDVDGNFLLCLSENTFKSSKGKRTSVKIAFLLNLKRFYFKSDDLLPVCWPYPWFLWSYLTSLTVRLWLLCFVVWTPNTIKTMKNNKSHSILLRFLQHKPNKFITHFFCLHRDRGLASQIGRNCKIVFVHGFFTDPYLWLFSSLRYPLRVRPWLFWGSPLTVKYFPVF